MILNREIAGLDRGDCTTQYTVEITEEHYTVGKFINDVLTQFPNEWGQIRIYTKFPLQTVCFITYSKGHADELFSSDDLKREIKEITSNGGRTLMHYHLAVEVD